jgi:hypothetical protein
VTYVERNNPAGSSVYQQHLGFSLAQFDQAVQVNSTDTLTSPDKTTNYNVPAPYTAPGSAGSSAQKTAALNVFSDPCAQAWLNALLEPATYAVLFAHRGAARHRSGGRGGEDCECSPAAHRHSGPRPGVGGRGGRHGSRL